MVAATPEISVARSKRNKRFYRTLFFQVLICAIGGALFGAFAPGMGLMVKPLGDVFVGLLKLMVAPIVFCTTISGIAGVPGNSHIGRTILKCLALFYGLTVLGLLVGFAAASLLQPGAYFHIDKIVAIESSSATPVVQADGILNQILPGSFLAPFITGGVLPALLVAVITSIGLRAIGPAGQPVRIVLEAFSKALSAAFNFLMKFAPLGAFGTIAYFVAVNGIRSIGNLGMFIFSMYVAAGFFVFGLLWLLAALHGFSFIKLLRYMREEILVVLSTSSSEPVLPAVMAKLENLGCGKNSIGISLPLGYSFNLSGTAIYIALATLFLAQTMSVSLRADQILPMGAVMLLAAKTAAGFSGSGFIALTTALAASHSTTLLAGTSFIAGIDRFQSEARAVTSLITNITSCVIIAIWEKECDFLQLKQELNGNSTARA